METKVLAVHVPLSSAKKVDRLAKRLERLTLEALADVGVGRVIDDQAVRAWADSLGTDTPSPPPRR